MFTISSFRNIKNKHDLCRGKDCMKIINFKKKKNEAINKRAAGII